MTTNPPLLNNKGFSLKTNKVVPILEEKYQNWENKNTGNSYK